MCSVKMLQGHYHGNHKLSMCNVEGKTYQRNSSSLSCIKMYGIKDDKKALFSSASWWWKTAFVALACGVMQSYYWHNVVPAVGMLGFLGDIFNMAGQSWCILTGH